jgi:hypothetical protein
MSYIAVNERAGRKRLLRINNRQELYRMLYEYNAIARMTPQKCVVDTCKRINRIHGHRFTLRLSVVPFVPLRTSVYYSIDLLGQQGQIHPVAYFNTHDNRIHILDAINRPIDFEAGGWEMGEIDNKNITRATESITAILNAHITFWL